MGRCATILLILCIVTCTFAALFSVNPPVPTGFSNPHVRVQGGAQPPPNGISKRTGTQTLTPQQIMAAYGITYSATAGAGKAIAIIDAFGCSTCESDLAQFSTQWGLPACTTANRCFNKTSQTGSTVYPADDATGSWGIEAAMDVQAVHAMAPGATIHLIACNSASNSDLYAGILYAANTLKVNYISMSFGAAEQLGINTLDYYFSSISTAYFASTGDSGLGVQYPAASQLVIGVGGTTLITNSGTFSSEQGWADSGGGCSLYNNATSAQIAHSGYAALNCANKKAVPDVSYVADPNSGMYVYFTGKINGAACTPPSCWYSGGGTSLACPLVAAHSASRGILQTPPAVYTGGYTFRDITVGNNGDPCLVGEDLVTGVGSLMG